MKVVINGDLERGIREVLERRLGKCKNISELKERVKEEVKYLTDTEIVKIEERKIFGIFSWFCEVFLRVRRISHKISASLGKSRNIVKYNGTGHNFLFGLIGYNRIAVESNLLYLRGKVLLYRLNRRESTSEMSNFLSRFNEKIFSSVLDNYGNLEGQIEKNKKSFSVEYIINEIGKIKIGGEKDLKGLSSKAELSVNPVSTSYARLIGNVGFYRREMQLGLKSGSICTGEYPCRFGGSFYFKFVWPVGLDGFYRRIFEAPDKEITFLGNIRRFFIGDRGEKRSIMSFLSRSSIHIQGEIEGERTYSLGGAERESTGSITGLIRYAVGRIGVVGGISMNGAENRNRTLSTTERNISSVFGVSYSPTNSIIDTVTVVWPWEKVVREPGLFSKLHLLEVNLSKEY